MRPSALRAADRWGLTDHPLDDLDQLLRAVGYESAPTARSDERFVQLVLLAAQDELAGRIVVQRLLPGLLSVVRKRKRCGTGETTLDELLGTMWIVIATYNPARRPGCLAAAIISDADYRTYRAPARRRLTELPTGDIELVARRVPAPLLGARAEVEELLDDALAAGVPGTDLDLLRALLDGAETAEIAERLQVSARTVRNRRTRITDRLREVALAA